MTRSQEKYSACVAYLISISFGTKVVLNHGPCLSGSAFFSSCLLFPFTANIKLMVASSTHIVQSSIASLQACVLNIIHSGERIKFQRTISNLQVPLYLMNISFMIWSIWRQSRKVRNLTSSIWKPGGSLKYRSKWGNSCSC